MSSIFMNKLKVSHDYIVFRTTDNNNSLVFSDKLLQLFISYAAIKWSVPFVLYNNTSQSKVVVNIEWLQIKFSNKQQEN